MEEGSDPKKTKFRGGSAADGQALMGGMGVGRYSL